MAFKGKTLRVGELIARANAEPPIDWGTFSTQNDVRWSIVDAARTCADLLRSGAPLSDCWRFGVLQTIDSYNFLVRSRGTRLAAQVFAAAPPRTGSRDVDAAFAALADHFARRDGWTPEPWVLDPQRVTDRWYVADIPAFEHWVKAETPPAFAERGVWIAANSLDRA
ncbi:MAG TPA: hypothetical protein PKE40_10700 [Arachnia sp.]|nr:hypothetical protein [Arachnia sp.]HMT86813.1 hypothetical protein [Arachnia sp.]